MSELNNLGEGVGEGAVNSNVRGADTNQCFRPSPLLSSPRTESRLAVSSSELVRWLIVPTEPEPSYTAEGWAGCLQNGMIVDRRVYPDATPIQRNSLLGVPEPQKRPNGQAHGSAPA